MPIRCKEYTLRKNDLAIIVLPAFCFFYAVNVSAAEYEYLIEATALAEQIENPRRLNDSDEDEFLSQQRLRATLSRATSKLVTNIDYEGTKNNYRDNLLQDRNFVTGTSSIEWILAPERFSWDLSNIRTLQIVDSLEPDTLDNRQVVSLTSTGPTITFPLSGRNKLSGSAKYSIADYQLGFLSSQDRISTDLLFSHNFSTSFISSIGANYLQSSFDETPALDSDRYEYFWQNQYITEVTDLYLSLGQNVLVRENFEDQENFLVRFVGSYKVNSQSTFELNYSDSYEDIFSSMLNLPASPTQIIGNRIGNSNLAENYELEQKGIRYIFTKSEFFNMNFGYSEADRTYDTFSLAEDQSDKVFDVGANWKLFDNLDLGIFARYTELEFEELNRDQERNEYGLNASYRISKSFYTRFLVFKVDQSGSHPVIDNYDGLDCSLSLTFVLGNK